MRMRSDCVARSREISPLAQHVKNDARNIPTPTHWNSSPTPCVNARGGGDGGGDGWGGGGLDAGAGAPAGSPVGAPVGGSDMRVSVTARAVAGRDLARTSLLGGVHRARPRCVAPPANTACFPPYGHWPIAKFSHLNPPANRLRSAATHPGEKHLCTTAPPAPAPPPHSR